MRRVSARPAAPARLRASVSQFWNSLRAPCCARAAARGPFSIFEFRLLLAPPRAPARSAPGRARPPAWALGFRVWVAALGASGSGFGPAASALGFGALGLPASAPCALCRAVWGLGFPLRVWVLGRWPRGLRLGLRLFAGKILALVRGFSPSENVKNPRRRRPSEIRAVSRCVA